ncbi:hypothetical protein BGZ73_007921 [Actinomortierella ambigua]|nr:hypothetical protein BGZ73_007921 [Actinomortierella ambigua]
MHATDNSPSQNAAITVAQLISLSDLIRKLYPEVKFLSGACKDLAHLCETACDIVRQVPEGCLDLRRLYSSLEQTARLLFQMSMFRFVLRHGLSLKDKIEAAKDDISAAMQAYSEMLAALHDDSAASKQSDLQREQAELVHTLVDVERPQKKAHQIFENGVGNIDETAVKRWQANCTVAVDESTVMPARFGLLYWAFFGDEGMVLVKHIERIDGTSTEDTVKRVKALSHWMRHCEGIMPVHAIDLEQNLVIYGFNNVIPLDVYLLRYEISSKDRWTLALKMAGALSYVHACKVIHRDIRAASVFMVEVTENVFEPKLAGFEICRSETTLSIGPISVDVWQAPERRQHGTSEETDVFAFGVLMYEIIMNVPPVWNPNVPGTIHDQVKQNVSEWACKSAMSASPKYIELMQRCLDTDHIGRPSMVDVFDALSQGYSPDPTALL